MLDYYTSMQRELMSAIDDCIPTKRERELEMCLSLRTDHYVGN